MFRKKPSPQSPTVAENPLARRFRQDAEPDTVDLTQPPRFAPTGTAADDPQTADLRTDDLQTDAARLGRVLSRDPGTGKLYVHPGTDDLPVLLQGEPVRAPTELRAGDTLRIGPAEIHVRSV